MIPFVVEISRIEVEEGITFPRLVVVVGSYDWSPGNRRRGPPDSYTPPWTELHIEGITDAGGRVLPVAVVERLKGNAQFVDAVAEALLDCHKR